MKCHIEILDIRRVRNQKQVTVKCTDYTGTNKEVVLSMPDHLNDHILVEEVKRQLSLSLNQKNLIGHKFDMEV